MIRGCIDDGVVIKSDCGEGFSEKTIGVRGPVVVQLLRLRFKKAAADFPAVSFTFVCLNCSSDCSRNDKAAAALLIAAALSKALLNDGCS